MGVNHTPVLIIPQSLDERESGNEIKEASNGHKVSMSKDIRQQIKFYATDGHGQRNLL